jgi:hypothetical protein
MERYAPIAVFGYRRQGALANLMESLFVCPEFVDSRVTIFIDGPRGKEDADDVASVRSYALGLKLPNVDVRISDTNMGLKASISAGVNLMCCRHGRVIVFEDDLVVSPSILSYFNRGLETYEHNKRVSSLSAYMYETKSVNEHNRAIFLPMPHPWGWATWRRSWQAFASNSSAAIVSKNLSSKAFREQFNVHGIRDFSGMLSLAEEGLINSWYIRWHYFNFINGNLCVFPPRSLVRNCGTRGNRATHGSRVNPYEILVRRRPITVEEVRFSTEVAIDFWAIDDIAVCWDARVQKAISLLGRVKRMLLR